MEEQRTRVYTAGRFYVEKVSIIHGGKRREFHIFSLGSGAGIVPVTPDGRFIMIQEYKIATGKYLWNWPGGGKEEGETYEQTAKREYKEETGDEILQLQHIADLHASPAYVTGTLKYYLGKVQGSINSSAKAFTKDEVEDMIMTGKILHSGTIAAFYLALKLLG